MQYLQNYQSLNENLSQAKSILAKMGKTKDDNMFKKIAEFTNKDGYVGLITKVVYELGLDIEKSKELYKLLKSKKVDLGNKDIKNIKTKEDVLTYIEKLQIPEEKKEDYEHLFEVNGFLVYRVNTYKGILEIGSPAWCLKTKSHWEDYRKQNNSQSETIQFVVIHKSFVIDHVSLLSVPDNWKGDSYKSSIPKMRFGITLYPDDEKICIHDDNNEGIKDIDTKFNKFLLQILYKIIEYGKKEKVEDVEFVKKYIKNFTGVAVDEEDDEDEEYDEYDEYDNEEEVVNNEEDEEFVDYIENTCDYFRNHFHPDTNIMQIIEDLLHTDFSADLYEFYSEDESISTAVETIRLRRRFTDAIAQAENRIRRQAQDNTNTDYINYRNDVFKYIHDDYGPAVNGVDVSDDACDLLNGRFNYLLRKYYEEGESPDRAAEDILDNNDFVSALENLEEPDDEDEDIQEEEERPSARSRMQTLRDLLLGRVSEEKINELTRQIEQLRGDIRILESEKEQLTTTQSGLNDDDEIMYYEEEIEEKMEEIADKKEKIRRKEQELNRLRNGSTSDEEED